ncbi:MAG: hypothetical protein HYS89_01170 [Candidatus Colwellbacteria bacterium]|nr:hypothetical protein [Candidatus Colwellbacteria bacterium]
MTSKPLNNLKASELTVLNALSSAGGSKGWVTASTIARVAREQGEELNAPTIYRVLSRLRAPVEYRTIGGVRRFHLKRNGQLLLKPSLSHDSPSFVSPGTPWSTQRQLKVFLQHSADEFLLVIDPYVSEETLDALAEVSVPIQILTSRLGRSGKEDQFLRAYKKFRKEKGGLVELRQSPGAVLHGRYLFTAKKGWVIDHSLQDLGTKPALVMPLHLGVAYGLVHQHFKSVFNQAKAVE